MALTAAEQVARDLSEFLAHEERPHKDWVPVLPAGDGRGLVAGYEVLPHVQAFADAVRVATKVKSIGTYPGHSPSIDRALDLFHAIGDHALADAMCDFAITHAEEFGTRYVISRQKIWHRLDPVWRWMEDRGSPTQNHLDHNHWAAEPTARGKPKPPTPPSPAQESDMALPIFGDSPAGREYAFWMIDGAFKKKLHTSDVWEQYQALAKKAGVAPPLHMGEIPLAMFDALVDLDELTGR